MFSPSNAAPLRLNDRLELIADYPFRRLAALLKDPPGGEPIQLSIGEPQHPAPPLLAEILAREAAGWSRYPPMIGTPEFRRAVADWLANRYELPPGWLDPDTQIVPLAGTREGLYEIAQVTLGARQGEPPPLALLPNPFYQVYSGAVWFAGGEPIFVDPAPDDLPDFAALPDHLLARAKLAYLCSPANPQGAVASLERLKGALALARRHGFTLALDECYTEIYLDAAPPGGLEAAAALGAGCDNLIVFHSLSKRSSVPGLRSGFAAGDPRLIAMLSRLRNYGGSSVPLPVLAASTALWREESHVETNRALYRAKFDMAEQILGGRWGSKRPAGAFYLWLDVGDGEAAALKLWRAGGIRTLPGAYLARNDSRGRNPGARFIRVALVGDLDQTRRALETMVRIL